jgi:two-component system sensor histidine kinase KdpD
VLSNLLENAVRFSPEGGRIDIELSRPNNETVQLAVRDRGIGIPIVHRPRIFEPFYQGHLEDGRSGLGLGLSIAHKIVEFHGGRIEAQFPEDGGTRMVVTLPARANDPSIDILRGA